MSSSVLAAPEDAVRDALPRDVRGSRPGGVVLDAGATVHTPPVGGGAAKYSDNGGPVIQIPRVQLIYWGNAWTSSPPPTPSADDTTSAVRTMLAGPYMTGLVEYRQVGRGHLLGASVISSSDPPNPFTDSDVANMISARIGDGTLPGVDEFNQNLYMVIMPQGVNNSTSGFVGEHTYYSDGLGHNVHFAWVTNNGSIDSVTRIFSHELVESCTDPEGSAITGVTGTCNQSGWCEIGDICSTTAVRDGVTVQSFWSDQAASCVVPDWPQEQFPQDGVQWTGTVPANESTTWFTYNWPEYLCVDWRAVPTAPGPSGRQIGTRVRIERASGAYITYWITVTNYTAVDLEIEGRFTILGIA